MSAPPEKLGFAAHYMDGKTASVADVRLDFDGAVLRATGEGESQEVVVWPLEGLRCERIPGADTLELRHRDVPGALITCAAPGLEQALRSRALPLAEMPRGRRLLRLLLINLAAVAALITLAYLSLPHLATAMARRIPLRMEAPLRDQVDVLLESSYCESATATKALEELRQRIEGAESPPRDLRILDVGDPNAFALPGGVIGVTRGLLEEAESADEIAGILAHEIQHVEQRHVLARVIRGALLSAAWAVTVGDFTGLMVLDPSTVFQIANLRFSRADEQSADRAAVAALDRAGISRDGMVRFFARLQGKTDGVPEWLSTHPASGRRARELSVAAGAAARGPLLSEPAWDDLRHPCKDRGGDRTMREALLGF